MTEPPGYASRAFLRLTRQAETRLWSRLHRRASSPLAWASVLTPETATAYAVAGRYGVQPDGIRGAASLMNSVGVGARGEVRSCIPTCSSVLVALAQVARRAGGDDVLPDRLAALRPRHDVVEGEAAVRRPAIGTAPAVTREEGPARDLALDRARHAHVVDQPDHMGPDEAAGRGAERLVEPLDYLGLALVHEHVGTPHRAHVERLVTCVQNKNVLQPGRKVAAPTAAIAARASPARPPPAPRARGILRRGRRRAP